MHLVQWAPEQAGSTGSSVAATFGPCARADVHVQPSAGQCGPRHAAALAVAPHCPAPPRTYNQTATKHLVPQVLHRLRVRFPVPQYPLCSYPATSLPAALSHRLLHLPLLPHLAEYPLQAVTGHTLGNATSWISCMTAAAHRHTLHVPRVCLGAGCCRIPYWCRMVPCRSAPCLAQATWDCLGALPRSLRMGRMLSDGTNCQRLVRPLSSGAGQASCRLPFAPLTTAWRKPVTTSKQCLRTNDVAFG